MKVTIAIATFAFIVTLSPPAFAAAKPDLKTAAAQLQKSVSVDSINLYMRAHVTEFMSRLNSDPALAEELVAKMERELGAADAGEDSKTKALLKRAVSALKLYRGRIRLQQTNTEELIAALKKAPNNTQALSDFRSKRASELGRSARSKPEQTEKQLAEVLEFLNSLREKMTAPNQKRLDSVVKSFQGLNRSIDAGKKLRAVIGKTAPELSVEAWANGTALTAADLKGKVVLLDFWAVWCGPCIATFPHLIEWNEKYADQGLVTIGLTRYYNYSWKDGKASRSKDVPHDEELQMLDQFAKQHKLTHRFGIQKGGALSDFYAVSGIPHVVLIDRHGKVRLMRVGSGPDNAEAIEKMLKELIAEGA
jgi:thiol-disulfide isomerase/thioredoxin